MYLVKHKFLFLINFPINITLINKLSKCFLFLEEEKFLDETGAWLAKYVCMYADFFPGNSLMEKM